MSSVSSLAELTSASLSSLSHRMEWSGCSIRPLIFITECWIICYILQTACVGMTVFTQWISLGKLTVLFIVWYQGFYFPCKLLFILNAEIAQFLKKILPSDFLVIFVKLEGSSWGNFLLMVSQVAIAAPWRITQQKEDLSLFLSFSLSICLSDINNK